jgi:hypothetical protein
MTDDILIFATPQRIKQLKHEQRELTNMKITELIAGLYQARPDNSQAQVEFIVMAQDKAEEDLVLTEVTRIESHHPKKVTIWLS